MKNLVYIFYHIGSEKQMKPALYSGLLQRLPFFVQEQVLKYRRWQDRQRAVVGKNLLLTGLQSLHPAFCSLEHLRYTALQRPYLDTKFDFNIAHSHDITVCAISNTTKVGIDIEKAQNVDLNDCESLFSKTEIERLEQAKNRAHAFSHLWTQKEAFVKAIGEGLHFPLNKIALENNKVTYADQDWFLLEIKLHAGYVCHLCTLTPSPAINLRELYFE